MRYREIMLAEQSNAEQLTALQQQHSALMRQWMQVVQTDPPPANSDANSDDSWWNDPARGGLWRDRLRPLDAQIRRMQADLSRQARRESENEQGFNTKEILYHGSNSEFEAFDRSKGRTVQHIYTSPDLETAEKYGVNVYALYGRQRPQANLTVEAGDYELLRRVYRRGGFRKAWGLSFEALAELVFDGQLYQATGNSGLQDQVVDICFSLGFKSVRIDDPKPGGGFSASVIFDDPLDLQIIQNVQP